MAPASVRAQRQVRPDGAARWDLWITGEVDVATRPELDDAVRQVRDEPAADVVVHLQEVTFFSAEGISALVRLREVTHTHGGHLDLDGPTPSVRRLLALCGLSDTLNVR